MLGRVPGDSAYRRIVGVCFGVYKHDGYRLATQARVRCSFWELHSCVLSNLVAFTDVIAARRHVDAPHLTCLSASSLYGANKRCHVPEHHGANRPVQFYSAAPKISEMMDPWCNHLFKLLSSLRFFTEYSLWSRLGIVCLYLLKTTHGRAYLGFDHAHHIFRYAHLGNVFEDITRASKHHRSNPSCTGISPIREAVRCLSVDSVSVIIIR